MEFMTNPSAYAKNATPFIFSLLITLLLFGNTAFCQTFDEIFKQKKTQIKYLSQQIIALQAYSTFLRKGYKVVGEGVNVINDFKNGEFNLHQSFITSLKLINPEIKLSPKIPEIISLVRQIAKGFNLKSDYLSESENSYIKDVSLRIEEESNQDLAELILVITAGKIEMKDDERMLRLDKVYESMKDKSSFVESFINDLKALIHARMTEYESIKVFKRLNNVL